MDIFLIVSLWGVALLFVLLALGFGANNLIRRIVFNYHWKKNKKWYDMMRDNKW